MGMYTHLCLNACTRSDAPKSVIATLHSMVAGQGVNHTKTYHKLFTTERWQWMLTSQGAYHPGSTAPVFRRRWDHPGASDEMFLAVNTSIKNYDDEWRHFLDWLAPFVEDADGYYRYEEDEMVTPIRIYEGQIVQGVPGT